MQNKCECCGTMFVPSNAGKRGREQKYCSPSCSLRGSKPSRMVMCLDCGHEFVHYGRGRRYRCTRCQKRNARDRSRACAVRKGRIKNPGVGSGGAQWGKDNHRWKSPELRKTTKYKGNYRLRCFKRWGSSCVACSSDVSVVAHHINGDPNNYQDNNLVPLCHECHKKVHSRKPMKTEKQHKEALFKLWPSGRNQIADHAGNPGDRQPEAKAGGKASASRND